MAKIFPFLFSLLAQAAWRRSGRSGGVPPFKVPGKSTTRLPMPSTWQIMMMTWVLERLWQAFGDDVKHKLTHTKSPSVNKLGQMIPAPGDAAHAGQGVPQTAPTSQPIGQPGQHQAQSNPANASHQPATSPPAAQTTQSNRASKTYNTQKLPQDPLPPGSVLGSMRSS